MRFDRLCSLNPSDPVPRFATQETLCAYGQVSALQNKAQPAWSDIDNDGDLNICFAVQETSEMCIEIDQLPRQGAPTIVMQGSCAGSWATDSNGQPAVRCQLTVPMQSGAELEVLTWGLASCTVDVPLRGPVFFFLMRWTTAGPAIPRFPALLCGVQVSGSSYFDALPPELRGKKWCISGGGLPGTVCELVRIPFLPEDSPPRPNL